MSKKRQHIGYVKNYHDRSRCNTLSMKMRTRSQINTFHAILLTQMNFPVSEKQSSYLALHYESKNVQCCDEFSLTHKSALFEVHLSTTIDRLEYFSRQQCISKGFHHHSNETSSILNDISLTRWTLTWVEI